MTFRHFAPALALSFLMISCAAEMTPEQKARAEQKRSAAKAKKERAKFELKKKQQVWKGRLQNISKEIKTIRESGQAAEKGGKLRQAFQLYIQSFRKYTDWHKAFALPYPPRNSTSPYPMAKRHGNEKLIRHLILRVSAKLDPPPAVPPAIERHSIRAGVYIRRAQSKAEFGKAIVEYWKALNIAPWWVDGYFNLALVMEKAGNVDLAIQYLKLYLTGKPNAPDIKSVQRKLIALEVVSEEMAPFKPWLGVWRGGNFRTEMKLTEKKLSLVITKVSEILYKAGWRKGGILFSGTLEGKILRGKYYYRTGNPKFIRCFGKIRPTSATASLVEKNRGLKIKYVLLRYLIRSCRITKRNPATLTVRR